MIISEIIKNALIEDIGDGDHTSLSTILPHKMGSAQLIAKEQGIICGLELAAAVFARVDDTLLVTFYKSDGDPVNPGDLILRVEGSARSILSAERTVLNFLQRMSGIATKTFKLSKLISEYPAKLLDTRKTTPLMRELEKYAVKTGGGENHRMGLYDMIMIKDNHVDFSGGISNAIDAVHLYLKRKHLDLKIELEVRSFEELQQVLDHGGVHRIMLDNFSPADLKKAVDIIKGRFETEASGGINEKNLLEYAATGVDYISIGALTHQIESLDLSLKAEFL
jgi:nicotinate-nucleotide pyrophosphorylase (carboxylating)